MCGDKKSNLKTVAPRNVIVCCVITGKGGVSYKRSTELYAILEGDLTGLHYRDEINQAFVNLILVLWTRTLWLWTETLCRACFVNEYTECEMNRRSDPPLMLIQQSM